MNDAAYAACIRLARRHYENFPVASRLLPRAARRHIAAVYAFARTADDFADEGSRADAERLALLDDWGRKLHDAIAGGAPSDGTDAAQIFIALGETIRACGLDVGLFDDLLSAFRQDVLVKRYESWADVLDYCRRSANPIGRIVLRIGGYRDAGLDAKSDAMCTALQLANFWQDFGVDWAKGRLYVPLAFARRAGAREQDLAARPTSPAWRAAIAQASGLTRALFAEGRPLSDGLRGRLRWEVRATWLGGVRILDRIEAADFDVIAARPAIGWLDAAPLAWRLLVWR